MVLRRSVSEELALVDDDVRKTLGDLDSSVFRTVVIYNDLRKIG
jgi:hypothetical protein